MKKINLLILGAMLIFGASFLFFSLHPPDEPHPPVKIGVVLPLSGDFEGFGHLGLQGAKMAVKEINETGGILNGQKLELVVQNNQSDPNISVRVMRSLIHENQLVAILGPVSSVARNAMVNVANQFKIPLLYGIDYEGNHYDRYLFCYSPIPDHVIQPLVPHLAENYGKKVYIFGYDYVWPHEMAKEIINEIEKINGDVVGIEFTPFGVSDFGSSISKIKNSGADVLMLIMCGKDGQRFAKQFHQSGLKAEIQLVAIASEETWTTNLDSDVLEGIVTNVHFLNALENSETKRLIKIAKDQFGKDTIVNYSTESHYGLIMLLKNAIEKAGTIDDTEKIIDAMTNQQIMVGNGLVTMREDHHMNLNMIIAKFKDGNLVVEKNLGLISPANQREKE